MRFADVVPDRWRTPPPHPNGWSGYQLPDHRTTQTVYDGLPLVTLEDKLLFVHDHRGEGWRLRKIGDTWRPVHD